MTKRAKCPNCGNDIYITVVWLTNKNGEKISLFPNKPSRDFVYVKDVLSANIYAWENYNDVCGNYYEVGSGIAVSGKVA